MRNALYATCKGKEEVTVLRTEGIDRCIVLRVRVGKHELRFLAAGYTDIPLLPLVYLRMSHYAHQRESVGKHGVYVWVMV